MLGIKLNYVILFINSLLLTVNFTLSKNLIRHIEINEDVTIISNVFHQIVDKFLVQEHIGFHIIVYKDYEWLSIEILNDFMAKNNQTFKNKILFHKYQDPFMEFAIMDYSAIIFLKSVDDIKTMDNFYNPFRQTNQPIKYFIFIPGLTYNQLKYSGLLNYYKFLGPFADFMFQYEYFIINEPKTVILASVEWFSPETCGEAHLRKLNVFNKISKKWTAKLLNHEKFLQYHGCELTLMSPVFQNIIYDVSNYATVNENLTNFEIIGIAPILFELSSKFHNFTASFQPALISLNALMHMDMAEYFAIKINGTYKMPQVYFGARSLIETNGMMRRSNAFLDINYFIAVTPAEAYTPYEKLFLPFDLETWIFLSITFFMTFLSIFFINFLSKSTQAIVYGHRVDTPFWNVVSIFFGISQTRLPNKNFSRFILILFVFFCLIFRTCFQSKFFEFMTSEPRRPPPKNIEDLIDNNYTMYLSREHNNDIKIFDERLRIQYISIFKFYEIFNTQSKNASAKAALYVDELTQNHIESINKSNHNWIEFQDAHMVSHETFVFPHFAFYFRMLSMTINRLIDVGVMKYLSYNYYTKKYIYEKSKTGPKVLSIDDMEFGFNIWLGFCFISFTAFMIEIVIYKYRNLINKIKLSNKKIKFAKVHPLVITLNASVFAMKEETLKKFRVKIEILPSLSSQQCISNNQQTSCGVFKNVGTSSSSYIDSIQNFQEDSKNIQKKFRKMRTLFEEPLKNSWKMTSFQPKSKQKVTNLNKTQFIVVAEVHQNPRNTNKIKFEKVWPMKTDNNVVQLCVLKSETLKKFKIKIK